MPRPIFTLLAELQSTLAELADALNPLQKLADTLKGHDGPFPMKAAGKKRGTRTRRTASAAPTKAARKPARKSRGTSARLALQGKYMSSLRRLSKADQAEVKKVRSEQGVEAALKVAASKAS
ncbi:MAG TPA: hypothetical protein VF580_12345 [Thermoanaerobaculia bacterium]